MAERDAILVLDAGPASLAFSLFAATPGDGAPPAVIARGHVKDLAGAPVLAAKDAAGRAAVEKRWDDGARLGHDGAVAHVVEWVRTRCRLAAVGHRVAHGGADHAAPVRVDAAVVAKLERLVPLAPLHLPPSLALMRALLARAPELPQVACFDTAMHRTQPPFAQMFALPKELEDAGLRRYGFHGLSYEHIAHVLPAIDARAARGRTVVLHLDHGASMCALAGGRSVATTMGFTALDGLPTVTCSGALDPGVLLYLMDQRRMSARAIEDLLYKRSGLLGVSGVSGDMRVLLDSSDPRAALAVGLFAYRIGRELGSLAAALGGLDAIVFSGDVGEQAAPVRERVCLDAAWLGVELDARANAAHEARISTAGSRTAAWVIPGNEALTIARHTRAVLHGG